jgi:hypothetical protein
MSLSDKLASAKNEAIQRACKIGVILVSKDLSDKDKQNLKAILDADQNDLTRVPNSTLAKILREEGYDVSNSAVDRHRRSDCACNRIGN